MLRKFSRSIAARRETAREMATMRWISQADPYTQWREIEAKVNQVLPGLAPLPLEIRGQKEGWAAFLTEYERRKAKGFFANPAASDAVVYGRKRSTPRPGGV
jgi:hypothetical protein